MAQVDKSTVIIGGLLTFLGIVMAMLGALMVHQLQFRQETDDSQWKILRENQRWILEHNVRHQYWGNPDADEEPSPAWPYVRGSSRQDQPGQPQRRQEDDPPR